MSSPNNVALYGHRSQLWLKNTTTGSQAAIDRVQSAEPMFNIRSDAYYELGRKGKIGTTQHPPEYRITAEQNLINSMEAEFLLAGKSIAPAGAQNFNLGDILTYSSKITAYVLNRNQDDSILDEQEYSGCSVSELQWRFTMGGAITQSISLIGQQGRLYTAANVIHGAWGALDNVSVGGIHGKDARIWFTSGSVATTRAYRLQNFTIRAAFPAVYVRELGNRTLVGTLSDVPEVTVDFDLLLSDDQPTEKFFTLQTTYYDYQNPLAAFNAYVRVFDPRDTEGVTTVKMFKIENVLPVTHTPVRAQVRGLATARYSLVMSAESTTDSGGLIISNRNDL